MALIGSWVREISGLSIGVHQHMAIGPSSAICSAAGIELPRIYWQFLRLLSALKYG